MTAQALSLGRSRGAVLMGRGLDITLSASLDGKDELPEAKCFEADVFYGDTRQNSQATTVAVQRGAANELVIRVRSSVVVDEPIVSVYLRVACGNSVSRRYVLLSDSPSDLAQPAPLEPRTASVFSTPQGSAAKTDNAAGTLPGKSNAAASGAAQATAPGTAAQQRRAQKQARKEARAAARAQKQQAGATAAESPQVAQAPSASARSVAREERRQAAKENKSKDTKNKGRPRLQLDPLEFAAPIEPSLKASAELLSAPSTDSTVREQAAALWRAINADPQDQLRDTQRLQGIESEVRSLLAQSKTQTQELAGLKSDLTQARTERYANPLVYALLALFAAALAFALYQWQARRKQQASAPWWDGQLQDAPAAQDSWRAPSKSPRQAKAEHAAAQASEWDSLLHALPPADAPAKAPAAGMQATQAIPVQAVEAFDLDLGDGELKAHASWGGADPQPGAAKKSAKPRPAAKRATGAGSEKSAPASASWQDSMPPDFGASILGIPRQFNAEELFDVQQQADFFLSLGQHAQAIEILKTHIAENQDTSALAYLDLFDIYHNTNNQADYAALREDFNRVFNAQAPLFQDYGIKQRGLEQYESAMSRIQALWPSHRVLDVIEESVFRKPSDTGEVFDLLAYRELMLLYAIAKDITDHERLVIEPKGKSTFSATEIAPLSASINSHASLAAEPELALADLASAGNQLGSSKTAAPHSPLGVDIDLSK